MPDMTPKAAEWFGRYVELGPGRSLEDLAQQRVDQGYAKTAPSALSQLKEWSSKYGWQDRIAQARSAEAERMLREAADLDATTFLETSKLLNERIGHTSPLQLDAVIKMRESVRKPAPKGSATVDVTVNVGIEVRQLAERIARENGVDADEVIAEAERILAEAR